MRVKTYGVLETPQDEIYTIVFFKPNGFFKN